MYMGFAQSSDTLNRFSDGFWISLTIRLFNSAVPLGNMRRHEHVSEKLGGMFETEGDMKTAVNVQTNKIACILHFLEIGYHEVERKRQPSMLDQAEKTLVEKLAEKSSDPAVGRECSICRLEDDVIVSPSHLRAGLEFMNRMKGASMAGRNPVDHADGGNDFSFSTGREFPENVS